MLPRGVWWLGLLLLAAPACGSGNGASPFMPTTPVADVCSMLALADVQTLLPGATAGTALAPNDNTDVWDRGCQWQGSNGMAITLIVEGPLTGSGQAMLGAVFDLTSTSSRQVTPVSGVGDKAVYLVNQGLDEILDALKGEIAVSLATYNFTPSASEASMQPLVVEALGNL